MSGVTDDFYIPPDEELTVPEITVSSPLLRAVSLHMGLKCDNICKEYMLCRAEDPDPRNCLKEGKDVTKCGLNFLYDIRDKCSKEVTAFAKCTEWNSPDLQWDYCRREQAIFDACMEKKLKAAKAPFGYFSQIRIHETNRPKPPPFVPEFPDRSKGMPVDYEGLNEEARHGTRFYFHSI